MGRGWPVGILVLSLAGCDALLGADFSDLHPSIDASVDTGSDATVELDADASLDSSTHGDGDVTVPADTDLSDDEGLDASDAGAEASDDASDGGGIDCSKLQNPCPKSVSYFQTCTAYWRTKGYELITLTAFDNGGEPLLCGAFIKTSIQSDWSYDLTRAQLDAAIAQRDAGGQRPAQISGYASPFAYVVLWVPKEGPTLVEPDISYDQLGGSDAGPDADAEPRTLLSVESYTEGKTAHFAAISVDFGVANGHWDFFVYGDDPSIESQDQAELEAGLSLVAASEVRGLPPGMEAYNGLWVPTPAGTKWSHAYDLPIATAQDTIFAAKSDGWQIRHLSATLSGTSAVVAATWSKP